VTAEDLCAVAAAAAVLMGLGAWRLGELVAATLAELCGERRCPRCRREL